MREHELKTLISTKLHEDFERKAAMEDALNKIVQFLDSIGIDVDAAFDALDRWKQSQAPQQQAKQQPAQQQPQGPGQQPIQAQAGLLDQAKVALFAGLIAAFFSISPQELMGKDLGVARQRVKQAVTQVKQNAAQPAKSNKVNALQIAAHSKDVREMDQAALTYIVKAMESKRSASFVTSDLIKIYVGKGKSPNVQMARNMADLGAQSAYVEHNVGYDTSGRAQGEARGLITIAQFKDNKGFTYSVMLQRPELAAKKKANPKA